MSAPVFSYAQAAKGRASQPQPSPNPASAAAPVPRPALAETTNGISKAATPAKPEKDDATRNTLSSGSNSTQNQVEGINDAATSKDELSSSSRNPSQTNDSHAPTNDMKENSVPTSETNLENKHETSSTPSENALTDSQKAKELDDEWEKISTPSSAPEKAEKELKAAPPPPVNVWQQRMTKAASQRPVQAITSAATTTPAVTSQPKSTRPSTDDTRRKPAKEQSAADTSAPSARRVNSGARPTRDSDSNQVSPRSTSLQGEKATTYAGPAVSDAESWPTPETATVDDRRRSSTIDKTDKPDSADGRPATQKKQWTQIPFVPTVKWQTPVPTSRRGGRPATRGRGGSSAVGERGDDKVENGSMAPPPLPKSYSEQDRGRKGATGKSIRAASLPVDGDQEDQSDAGSVRPSVNATGLDATTLANTSAVQKGTPTSGTPSQTSSRHPSRGAQTRRNKFEDDLPEPLPIMPVAHDDVQSFNKTAGMNSRALSHDGAHNAREATSDRAAATPKEWNRDRNSSSREKSDWRERRDQRSDRGRGSYRGRGNHTPYSSNGTPYTAPLPQNGFEVPKAGHSEPRSRQSSQPFTQSASFGVHRGNPRAQSIPLAVSGGAFYPPAPGFPHVMSPIQAEMPFPSYGQIPSMMPNMPYQDPLNTLGTMSMVATQLQYYFSVDNLCKDMYLRKHMDSEGFVPLRVVADFNRVKALLGEGPNALEQLHEVALSVPSVELMSGDGGEDRVRCRDKWQQFILPAEERVNNTRSPTVQPHTNGSVTAQIPAGIRTDYGSLDGSLRSAPPQLNGFHESFHPQMGYPQMPSFEPQVMEQWSNRPPASVTEDERRSSATSPLGKVQSPAHESRPSMYGRVNGHRASSSIATEPESSFPDEEVARLKIVVKDPEYHEDEDRSPSHTSQLRGGAASPDQLGQRLAELRFGQTAPLSAYGQPLYFTQHEQPPESLSHPSYVHEDYFTLRDKAIAQRAENHLSGAVAVLFTLWADFLPREGNFNMSMYEDFRDWALEDARNGNYNGKNNLVQFYAKSLKVAKPVHHRVATDIVQVAREEPHDNRPTWQKLQAAWRDGATNVRSRKRILDVLTEQEKAELDR